MEEKTVKLNIDVEESITGLKQLKQQLKNTAAGSEEFKQLYNQIDDLEDKIKSAKATSSDWIDSMADAGGVLGVVGQAINDVKVSTQTFGGALKATGIGLIVSLLGGLVAAFNDNDQAMKKIQPLLNGLAKIFQGVFKVVEPLFNILVDMALKALPMVMDAVGEVYSYVSALAESFGAIGKAIYKLIQGDFKGAWESAKSSVTDFSKHHDEAKNRYISGTEEMTKSDKEAAEKAKELREKQAKEAEAAAAKAKAARDKAEADRIAKAKADQEARLALAQAEFDSLNELRGIQDGINATNDAVQSQKEADDQARRKANYEADKLAAEEAEQAKIDIRNKGLDNLTAGIDVLKGVTSSSKELQKALLIAEAAISIARIIGNTQAANSAIGLKYALLPGGEALAAAAIVKNNISAGIGIASTIAATAKGLSALGGGSAPSGTAPSGGGGGGGAPTFNVIGANPSNQLAQSLGNKENTPIKTYVVAGEVTTAQQLQKNIINTATMG